MHLLSVLVLFPLLLSLHIWKHSIHIRHKYTLGSIYILFPNTPKCPPTRLKLILTSLLYERAVWWCSCCSLGCSDLFNADVSFHFQVTEGRPSTLSVCADKVARMSFHISELLYLCTLCSIRYAGALGKKSKCDPGPRDKYNIFFHVTK